MCGLLGFSFKKGALTPSRRAVLATALARYNDTRGGMSYGVVGVDHERPKVARGFGDLFDNAHLLCEYDNIFAHTRFASVGDVTLKNAHPFKMGNVLGAHNGGIFNHEAMAEKYHRKFEVDSMHVFAHMNEGRDLEELIGYGAIEWVYLNDPKTIRLTKFIDGELSIFGVGSDPRDTTGIIWSSDPKHALKAIESAGLENSVFRFQVRRGTVYAIHDGEMSRDPGIRLNISQYTPEPEDEEPNYLPFGCRTDNFRSYHMAYGNRTPRLVEHSLDETIVDEITRQVNNRPEVA